MVFFRIFFFSFEFIYILPPPLLLLKALSSILSSLYLFKFLSFTFGIVQEVVPKRILKMEEAIKNRDFASFAQLTCPDSNQFHAVCLDTSPPIFYMNDTSHRQVLLSIFWLYPVNYFYIFSLSAALILCF